MLVGAGGEERSEDEYGPLEKAVPTAPRVPTRTSASLIEAIPA